MSTVSLAFATDAAHTLAYCSPDGRLPGNWAVSGDTDYGAAVATANDAKNVNVASGSANNLDFTLVDTGLIPNGVTISSVVVHTTHKTGAGTLGVNFLLSRPCGNTSAVQYTDNPHSGSPFYNDLSSTSFVEYTATLTTDPHTGAAWTAANLYASHFSLQLVNSGGGNTYTVDQFYIVVNYVGPTWWQMSATSLPLLSLSSSSRTSLRRTLAAFRYRPNFNFTFNFDWFWYGFGNPGTNGTYPYTTWAPYLDGATPPPQYGWFTAVDGFAGSAAIIASSIPADPRSYEEISTFATGATGTLGGSPSTGCVIDNLLVYPARSYTVGTDLPPIHIFDGFSDREFIRLPKTAAGAVPKAVLSMLVANGTVYLSTYDSGTSSTTWAGRVFALDVEAGVLTPVGDNVFTGGQLPYALAWHNGQLWVGTHRQTFGSVGSVYRIRPDATAGTWTKDHDLATGSVSSMYSFGGKLYVGCMNTSGTFALLVARSTDGTWATADTGAGGTAAAGNGYLSMLAFGGNLYATFWNNDTTAVSTIRKFDGTSWTTAYSGASTTLRPFVLLFADSGVLYAYGGGLALKGALVSTTDGSSWSDLTTQLPASSQGLPIASVVVQ